MNVYSPHLYIDAADPAYVVRPLCIEAGEVEIDATGCYCGTSGKLLSVQFNGQIWEPKRLRSWLQQGASGYQGNWSRDLTREEIDALIGEEADAHTLKEMDH